MPITRSWKPDYLVNWFFDQGEFWVTGAGESIRVKEMSPTHALYTLLMLERVAGDLTFPRDELQSTPLYMALIARVERAFE